jgi:dihydropteroate synthase
VTILDFFIERVQQCRKAGIHDIILDPGLGFGKSIMDNYAILDRLEIFEMLELPLLIGASRKSMIYRLLDVEPREALNGTTAVNMFALGKGADILRVHDVAEARQCLKIHQALLHSRNPR